MDRKYTRVAALSNGSEQLLHKFLDAAVAAAYGWERPLAPFEIVSRLAR